MVVLSACLTSKAGKPLVARQVLAFGVRACEPFRACVRARQRWWQPERASGDRTCQCRCRARDCTGAEVAPATFALVRCNSGRHCFGCCCCCCCCCCSLMGEWDPCQWPACFIPHPSNTYTATTQFVEMSRIRIEGLLAAFPKLVTTGNSQHTYVETESVRYVYQPMEALYLLLITNKSSNIMEDLETLRLLAKLVPEFCQAGLDEEGVREHAFDLILAFDEVRAGLRSHAQTRKDALACARAHARARARRQTDRQPGRQTDRPTDR